MSLVSKDERVLQEQLRYSKTQYSTWGRDIIRAIDIDDPIRIIQTLQSKKHLGADINSQTDTKAYGGYAWTPWMHRFLGDTALHIAIKQKKMLCISILLLLEADTSIPNAAGKTSDQLLHDILHRTKQDVLNNSWYYLLPAIDPEHFHLLPDTPSYRSIKKEALYLLHSGRCLYTEAPSAVLPNEVEDEESVLSAIPEDDDSHASNEFLQAMLKQKNRTTNHLPSYFVKNNIQDVVTMLHNQNRLSKRLYHDEQLKKSGLTILRQNTNTSLNSNATSNSILQKALTSLSSFKTLSKSTSAKVTEKQEKRFISDFPYRHITELSTLHNLKYMHFGDESLLQLLRPLDNNRMIERIILSNGHITDVGAAALANILHRIHALSYLDLSQNGLTDAVAPILASAIKISVSLKRVSVAANRLTVVGAEILINCVFDSSLAYLNLRKNKLSSEDVLYLKHIITGKTMEWRERQLAQGQEVSELDDNESIESEAAVEKKIIL